MATEVPNAEHYRRQLEAVCNNATVALFIMNERQQCVYMNPAAEKLTGYSLSEVQGQVLHNVVHHTRPDGRPYPLEECPIDQALPQNNQEQGEEIFVHKDGTFYPVVFTASPIREAGVPVGTIIEVRGVAEEKRAERERDRFFHMSLDILCIGTLDGRYKRINPAFVETLGWTEEELMNRPLLDLIHPDDVTASIAEMEKLQQGARTLHFEQRLRCRDGSYKCLAWSCAQYIEEKLVYAVGHDITEQRRQQRTLQLLVDLNQATQPLTDPDEVMAVTARLLGEHLGANRCAYAEIEADEDHFLLTGNYTRDTFSIVGRYAISSFGDEALRLMRAGDAYVVEDVESDPRTAASLAAYRQTEIAAAVSVPLLKEGRFAAGMAVHQKAPRRWTPEEIELIGLVVNRCWEALERARAIRSLRQAHDELELRVQQRTAELSAAVGRLETEVDERERTEATLQGEREYLRVVLENIEDGVVACDDNGVLTFFNRATQMIHGLPSEPLPAEQWAQHYDLFLSDGQTPMAPHQIPLFRALQGERIRNVGMVIAPRDGPPHRLLASGRALFGVGGQKLGAVVIMHDITAQQQAEEEREHLIQEREARKAAEKSNQIKDEFLATLSHELRTPLTAILGWTHMLRAGRLAPEDTQRAMETIERNAQAQLQLIEDLLDVSRIITGKMRVEVAPVELTEVVKAAVEAVRPAAQAKTIRLQVLLDPQAGPVSGDAARLQQVIWNLLTNAVKFTPKGGRVQVRLERVNSHVEIAVTDTGQGIDSEFLPHIFDRFRQADQTSTRTFGGLGLGLSIVHQLVELHGGVIQAHSSGAGQGATFVVQLPLMAVHYSQEQIDRRHPTARSLTASQNSLFDCPPQLDRLRVMVVDDEADTRDLLRAILESCGSEVVTAASAAEALEMLERWKPDVLISDIGMPGEDGYSLIGKVRALEAQHGGLVPAIALTAYARVEDRVRALTAGFHVHVPKPIEPVELIAVVASLAKRP